MTRAALLKEIEGLSIQERLELAFGLLDSILSDATAPPLSDAQRNELQRRLAEHRADPHATGVTLDEIRQRLAHR